MSKVLVKWESNWADEMDISGFAIVSTEYAEIIKKSLILRKESFDIYIGTNEEIHYETGKNLLDELSFQNISDEEGTIIAKYLGGEFGFTEFLCEIEEE